VEAVGQKQTTENLKGELRKHVPARVHQHPLYYGCVKREREREEGAGAKDQTHTTNTTIERGPIPKTL
jgi:hypothetical protein